MAITPLPSAPLTTDTPQQFNTKAFAWVQALDTFVSEANAQAVTVNSDASSASSSASTATTKAAEAAASAAAAVAAANVTQWSSGATYAAGDNVWSSVDYQTYRNKTGTNTATDPSSDSTNWELVSGNVTLTTEQTLTNKTITGLLESQVSTTGTGSPLTQDIDLDLANWFTHDLNSNSPPINTTFSVSNVPASGTTASFVLELNNAGAVTITWFSGVQWAGGIAPTLTTGRDVLGFFTFDGGTTWTGLVLGLDIQAP